VELLLKQPKINPMSESSDQSTPLSYACLQGHAHVVEAMLRHKRDVDVNKLNRYNCTPLWYCSRFGFKDCVEQLVLSGRWLNLQHKSNAQHYSAPNLSAKQVAREYAHEEIADLLAAFEVDPMKVRFQLRRKYKWHDYEAACIFLYGVMLSDGYFNLLYHPSKYPLRNHHKNKHLINIRRFFDIFARLPMELQMILSIRVFGLKKDFISFQVIDQVLKEIVASEMTKK